MTTEHSIEQIESPTLASRISGWMGRSSSSESAQDASAPATYWWEWASYGGLVLIALVMRVWDLGSRALHHDESLHAFYSWQLFDGGGFQHNPMMHGPLQFEANAAIFFAFGDSDFSSRLLYALLGTILVALPFFFRDRLGKLGAIFVAGLLAFSPALLYFSRFARNDILMAVWTVLLVICIWRYIDEGKNRYIYIIAGVLAFAFATKETAYLISAMFGLFLFLTVLPDYWRRIRERIHVDEETPSPIAIGRVIKQTWGFFSKDFKFAELNRPAALLFILITLTMPQWSAIVGLFQETPLLSWLNLTLVNPDGVHPIGSPSGGGILIAALIVLGVLTLSAYWGFLWNWSVWWRSAAIFYTIWVLLYSTFFTNPGGIGSGVWRGLGYWISQQDVARGNQPWYYYFVITPLYEYLPMVFGIVAAVYYFRRRDRFGLFLVFWVVATLVLYTWASEKMPWLLVNVTLPLIVLSGKFLGDVVQGIEWRRLISGGGILAIVGIPLLLVVLWQLAFFEANRGTIANVLILLGLGVTALALIAGGLLVARRSGATNFAAFATVPVVLILLVLTIRTGWTASFRNGDTPVEMIVYTQTSPDVTRLMRQIEYGGEATGQDFDVPIAIDQTSGFTWPWAWYLRDYNSVNYPSYEGDSPLSEAPDSSLVLVHSNNRDGVDTILQDSYSEAELVRHRWWFPESTYRGLTVSKIASGLVDRQTWRNAMDYFLYRQGLEDRLGSEDAYIYFDNEFPLNEDEP